MAMIRCAVRQLVRPSIGFRSLSTTTVRNASQKEEEDRKLFRNSTNCSNFQFVYVPPSPASPARTGHRPGEAGTDGRAAGRDEPVRSGGHEARGQLEGKAHAGQVVGREAYHRMCLYDVLFLVSI